MRTSKASKAAHKVACPCPRCRYRRRAAGGLEAIVKPEPAQALATKAPQALDPYPGMSYELRVAIGGMGLGALWRAFEADPHWISKAYEAERLARARPPARPFPDLRD